MSYIKSRNFTTSDGRSYEIVQTDYGPTKDVLSAVDTVKNPEGIKKKMTRYKTLEFIKS